MIDLEHQCSRPESKGTITICGKSVELYCCRETMMGEPRFFWHADCDGRTIATCCATRRECVEEAREFLRGN